MVQDSHGYDWIIFTSPNGVDAFFDLFYKLYDDAREIGGARIAAIGPATANRVKDFHLKVDLSRANSSRKPSSASSRPRGASRTSGSCSCGRKSPAKSSLRRF